MALDALNTYKSAHARALKFFTEAKLGPKFKDYLRAAVVFEAAAIDVFFKIKIINHCDKKKYRLTIEAQKWIYEAIAKENFGSQCKDLSDEKVELIEAMASSGKRSLRNYVLDTLETKNFQSADNIEYALKMIGYKPIEIWSKLNHSRGKKGRRINTKIRLENLFKRRHQIVHQADIFIRGRRSVGKEDSIALDTVKDWLDVSEAAVTKLNKLI